MRGKFSVNLTLPNQRLWKRIARKILFKKWDKLNKF